MAKNNGKEAAPNSDSKPIFDAFAIVEQRGSKARWVKLGPAFQNRDGSFTAFCQCIPLDVFLSGELKVHIRQRDEQGGGSGGDDVPF